MNSYLKLVLSFYIFIKEGWWDNKLIIRFVLNF